MFSGLHLAGIFSTVGPKAREVMLIHCPILLNVRPARSVRPFQGQAFKMNGSTHVCVLYSTICNTHFVLNEHLADGNHSASMGPGRFLRIWPYLNRTDENDLEVLGQIPAVSGPARSFELPSSSGRSKATPFPSPRHTHGRAHTSGFPPESTTHGEYLRSLAAKIC